MKLQFFLNANNSTNKIFRARHFPMRGMDVSDETKKQWKANFLQFSHVSKVSLANKVFRGVSTQKKPNSKLLTIGHAKLKLT